MSSDDIIEAIHPPFTLEQVESINEFQASGKAHPFTCPAHSDRALMAMTYGLICPSRGCDYLQEWVHDFMADGSWKEVFKGCGTLWRTNHDEGP